MGVRRMAGSPALIIFLGIIVLVFFIWVGALFIIGMCDMMSDIHAIRRQLVNTEERTQLVDNYNKLVELRDAGLITQDDFNRRVQGR